MSRKSVIYLIHNIANGKGYVGSAARGLADRKYQHLLRLRSGKHHSIHLQRAWNKYGEEAFKWVVLEKFPRPSKEELIAREQYWLDKLKTYDRHKGYNLSPTAGSNEGCAFYQSESFKNKQSVKAKKMGFGLTHKPRTKQHSINQGKTQAKLSAFAANNIFLRVTKGEMQKDLAEEYGVCQQTISNIVRRRGIVYGGISREEYKQKPRSRITKEDRESVKHMYNVLGLSQLKISQKTGFSQSVISNIVRA